MNERIDWLLTLIADIDMAIISIENIKRQNETKIEKLKKELSRYD